MAEVSNHKNMEEVSNLSSSKNTSGTENTFPQSIFKKVFISLMFFVFASILIFARTGDDTIGNRPAVLDPQKNHSSFHQQEKSQKLCLRRENEFLVFEDNKNGTHGIYLEIE